MLMATLETAASAQPRPYRILICDDQPDVLEALRLLLKQQGHQAVTVDSPGALLRKARAEAFDLILVDLNYTRDTTSGEEGLDLLASLDAQGNAAPVVVMTAWGSIELAVEAMRRGACDFIQKPWDNARVMSVVRKQAESERLRQSELEIAAHVQQKLFPHAPDSRMETVEYEGRCVAARTVGGDYYDFLDLGEGKMAVLLGDVSGKGVPAALLMANLQACFRSQDPRSLLDPSRVLEMVNRHFFDSTAADRFATLFYCVYDDARRSMRYVNCGHVPPLLMRQSGQREKLDATATMLGAFRRWDCAVNEIEFGRGDTLLIYSDGVTEAFGPNHEDFGEERLVAALRRHRAQAPGVLADSIIGDVTAFQASQSDDITVVALRGL
jgi:sigma-B regulation protein RsbU (phosphoserine phosphatase)